MGDPGLEGARRATGVRVRRRLAGDHGRSWTRTRDPLLIREVTAVISSCADSRLASNRPLLPSLGLRRAAVCCAPLLPRCFQRLVLAVVIPSAFSDSAFGGPPRRWRCGSRSEILRVVVEENARG